ncbi:hypothetical protein FYZ34_06120 [Mobiluncus mulieris]|nr:hypothetical protein [Mobiluncus mulieris]
MGNPQVWGIMTDKMCCNRIGLVFYALCPTRFQDGKEDSTMNKVRKFVVGVLAGIFSFALCVPVSVASTEMNILRDATSGVSTRADFNTQRATSQSSVVFRKIGDTYYVNDNVISFNFEYYSQFYDKTAWYVSDFRISPTPKLVVEYAYALDYETEWQYSKSKDNVLALHVTGIDGYTDRRCGGVYTDPNDTYKFDETTLIIDPDTGRVFDFIENNYFYKHGFMKFERKNVRSVD